MDDPGKRPKCPERDLKLEALGKVLRRELKARIHAHRADDMLTAIRQGVEAFAEGPGKVIEF